MSTHFRIYTVDSEGDEPILRGITNTVEGIDPYYERAITEQVSRFIIRDNLGGLHLNRDMSMVHQ
jgi:hypothetical protein